MESVVAPYKDAYGGLISHVVSLLITLTVVLMLVTSPVTATISPIESPTTTQSNSDHIASNNTSNNKHTSIQGVNATDSTVLGRVPIVTGQIVTVVAYQDGQRAYHISGDEEMRQLTIRNQTYIFPKSVNFDQFSPSLFNIDLLLEQNITVSRSRTFPVMIQFKDGTFAVGQDSVTNTISSANVRPTQRLEAVSTLAGEIPIQSLNKSSKELRSSERVQKVYYNPKVSVSLDDANEFTAASTARRQFNVSGKGVTIAILDTGVNETHPDLDDGKEIFEQNFVAGEDTTRDIDGHGTHVAGIAAGSGDASGGQYTGFAPNASILDMRVLGADGTGSLAAIINGVTTAAQRDADIISMSLGVPQSTAGMFRYNDPAVEAIRSATGSGSTVVISAGNSGPGPQTISTPGVAGSAITVAAADKTATGLADFSSRGPTLGYFVKPDVTAPGTAITSANKDGERYVTFSGTSMAAPAVSGTAALLLESNPGLTPSEIKSRVTGTADTYNGVSVYAQGGGLVNVTDALSTDLAVTPGTVDFGLLTANTTVTEQIRLTNTGNSSQAVELDVQATDITDAEVGHVTLNRTQATVPAQGSTVLNLTVDTENTAGVFSGRLTVTNTSSGEVITTNFGYARGYRVSVQKEPLETDGQETTGDTIIGAPERELLGSRSVKEYTGNSTEFISLGGNFTVLSIGENDATGETIITAEQTTVTGDTTIRLNETQTSTYSVNVSALPQQVSPIVFESAIQFGGVSSTAISRRVNEVRLPKQADADVSVEMLAAPGVVALDSQNITTATFDRSKAYLLEYATDGVTRDQQFTPTVGSLAAINVSYYRTSPNQTYSATLQSLSRIDEQELAPELPLGDRRVQKVLVNPSEGNLYAVGAVAAGGSWELTPFARFAPQPDTTVNYTVNRHPLFGASLPTDWRLSDEIFTTNRLVQGDLSDAQAYITGSRYFLGLRYDGVTRLATSIPLRGFNPVRIPPRTVESGTEVTLVTDVAATAQPLSTRVNVRERAVYSPFGDSTPPTLADVIVEDLTLNNTVRSGTVSIVIVVEDTSAIESLDVMAAEETSSQNQRPAEVVRLQQGVFRATLSLNRSTNTPSLLIKATDNAGNTAQIAVQDAFRVERSGIRQIDPAYPGPPTDPDSDGLFEDINGDGKTSVADVVALFRNRGSSIIQRNIQAFDFSGDEAVSLADVVRLFQEAQQ